MQIIVREIVDIARGRSGPEGPARPLPAGPNERGIILYSIIYYYIVLCDYDHVLIL